jgi:hypothetical protein
VRNRTDREIDAADRPALNQDCLKRVDTEPRTAAWLPSYPFKLNNSNGLLLSIGRCSDHAKKTLDAIGDIKIKITIPAADLKASLAPYHRAVVLALAVRQEGSDVLAVEQTGSQGHFELMIEGGSLVGTWPDKDNGQRLPVIFQ